MLAMYYMGQSRGKSRKDDREFFAINILAMNKYGSITVAPLYVSEQQYNEILSKEFAPGDPVVVNVSFTGVFNGMVPDTRYSSLELDAPAKPKDTK